MSLIKYIKQPISGSPAQYASAELRKIEKSIGSIISALEATTGTFTPGIRGITTAGVATYVTNDGFWMKQGKVVIVHARTRWSAHTGSGGMQLTGLPFTSANTTGGNDCYTTGAVYSAVGVFARIALLHPNSTIVDFWESTNPIARTALTGTGEIIFSLCYRTE